jgi:hypothetical protein
MKRISTLFWTQKGAGCTGFSLQFQRKINVCIEPKAQLMSYSKTPSSFHSQGETCSGWWYRPEKIENPAVIIMAHGFATELNFILDNHERFARCFVPFGTYKALPGTGENRY